MVDRSALVRRVRFENVRPHRGALGPGVGGDDARHDVAAEGRPGLNELALLVDGEPRAVGGEAQAQPRRHPRGKVAAVGGGTEKQHRRLLLGHHGRQRRRETIGGIAAEEFVAAADHPVRPLVAEPFQPGQAVVAQHHRQQGLPQPLGQPAAVGEKLVNHPPRDRAGRLLPRTRPRRKPPGSGRVPPAEAWRRSMERADCGQTLTQAPHRVQRSSTVTVSLPVGNRAEGARFFAQAAEIADVMIDFQHVSNNQLLSSTFK